MKGVCSFCDLVESDGKGGLRCGAASYRWDGTSLAEKHGAVCIHDTDLKDLFKNDQREPHKMQKLSDSNKKLKDKVKSLKEMLSNVSI